MFHEFEVCVELLMEYRRFGIFMKEQKQRHNGNLLGKSNYLNRLGFICGIKCAIKYLHNAVIKFLIKL